MPKAVKNIYIRPETYPTIHITTSIKDTPLEDLFL
jgi:hypothetical protein